MVDLDFGWVPGNSYQSGTHTIEVTRGTFVDFPMFDKVKFQDVDGIRFVYFTISCNGKKYTYDRNLEHWSRIVDIYFVEVFVFKDNKTNPVLVGLNNGGKYYYYTISESKKVNNEFELRTPYHHSFLNLFETLIDENDKINNTTTFRIDKKDTYKRINHTIHYVSGFSAYKHVPKEKYNSSSPIVLKGKTMLTMDEIPLNRKDKNFDYVTVYYRDRVPHSEIPLLIEFSYEKTNYYFCKEKISQKYWTKIDISENNLQEILDEVEAQLIYSVPVSIDEKNTYAKGLIKSDINPKKFDFSLEAIKVSKNNQLSNSDYVCYEHDLSVYNPTDTKQKTFRLGDSIKTLFINIYNIPIEVTEDNIDSFVFFVDKSIKLYVWFYKNLTKTDEDNLPLMIQYDKIYTPKSRDDYFDKWEAWKSSIDFKLSDKIYLDKIREKLDLVNFMLNTIDLNHNIVDTSEIKDYGIPRPPDLNTSFNTIRIHFKPESYNKLFFKCTHSTKNGYLIGQAHYTKQIYYQRGTKEKFQLESQFRKNEKLKCSLNINSREVIAYYFKCDFDSEYPLIVEYRLSDGKYEYHLLQCDFTQKAEYKFTSLRCENKIEDIDLFTILRHQNFIFHNVIDIILDKRSPYTCCDILKNNKHLAFTTTRVQGLKSCRLKYENSISTTNNLPFIEVAELHKTLYGYIVYKHSLTTFSTNNEVSRGSTLDYIKIKGFKVNNSEINLIGSPLEGEIFVRATHVYVYFYSLDPRPLLLCYNHRAYSPKDKSEYYKNWHPVRSVKNFISNSQRESNSLDSELLGKLNYTVGFLNTVNLYEHNGDINHTYKVHTYNGQDVKISVKSEHVSSLSPSSSNSCYKKLTHTPNGINGIDAEGFRLGNIEYNNNGLTGKLNYSDGDHKWYPLTSVSVYYYTHDKKHEDPLLVELEFTIGTSEENKSVKEYYNLKTLDENKLEWVKDNEALDAVSGGNVKLGKHLDCIRYRLKKVLKIELDKQYTYQLMVSEKPGDDKGSFINLNGYQVPVEECDNCPKLSNQNYKILKHKLSTINPDFDYNSIGGIRFTLKGTNGKPIEIPIYDSKGSKSIGNLNYDRCMGDFYVYFCKESDTYDPVPLFILFNSNLYMPNRIEDYFTQWYLVEESQVFPKLNQMGGHRRINEYVNKVKMPNQVDIFGDYSIELARSNSREGNEIPPVNELEIVSVKHIESPFDNGVTADGLEDGFLEDLQEPFSIHGYQPKDTVSFNKLDFFNEFDPSVKFTNGSQEVLKHGIPIEEELPTTPVPAALSSTGLNSYSDESNQSYLGYSLGGTFGSLITIGAFTLIFYKYFRRVKVRNMVPLLY